VRSAPAGMPSVAELLRSDRIAGRPVVERESFFVVPARFAGLLVPKAFDDTPEEFGIVASRGFRAPPYEEYFTFETAAFADSIFLGPAALLLAAWAVLAGRKGRFLLLAALVLLVGAGGIAFGVEDALAAVTPG